MRPRLALALSTLLILVATVPWRTFTDHAHWDAVRWVPLVSPPQRVGDWAANVALYMPFGYSYARQRTGSGGILWRAIAYAGLLSTFAEMSQVFSHNRFPSTTDVTFNVLGACAGAEIARWRATGRASASLPQDKVA